MRFDETMDLSHLTMRARNSIVLEHVVPGKEAQEKDCSKIVCGCIEYATNDMLVFYINIHDMMASHKNQFAFQNC
jgi:hypothetical protein